MEAVGNPTVNAREVVADGSTPYGQTQARLCACCLHCAYNEKAYPVEGKSLFLLAPERGFEPPTY